MIADTISNAFELPTFFNECLKLNITFFCPLVFQQLSQKHPYASGLMDSSQKQLQSTQFSTSDAQSRILTPCFFGCCAPCTTLFPPSVLLTFYELLCFYSHTSFYTERQREREKEREIYYSGLLQFVPTRIRVWNNCPPPVSSDNYATKPFECFIFFSFYWFILSPSSVQLLWTPVGRKTAVIKSQLLHLWSLINDVGEQARRAAGCNHWGVVTG